MRKAFMMVAAAMMAAMSLSLTSCKEKGESSTPQPAEANVEKEKTENGTETYFEAIDNYLTEQIASHYAEGEKIGDATSDVVCIPCHTIVGVDEQDSTDIKVWGDYWVFNYRLSGDTLKCVSGGSHPGLMHVRQTGGHFEVTAFDGVEDGSRFLPSARRIFAGHFANFQKIAADEKNRQQVRTAAVAAYAEQHHLAATMYQDYGWPPVKF
jgi:hypothetical protein